MIPRSLSAIVFGLALAIIASAQNVPTTPPALQPQAPSQGSGGWQGGQGQRGGGGMMGMGRGLLGTVTEAAADHYTIKTDAGEVYTVHFSVNTRIVKQVAGTGERGDRGQAGQGGEGDERGGNPPQPIKPADIKVGDALATMGEVDAASKSVGATVVVQLDPQRAKQMRAMQANYGKTWLAGKVTAIDGVKVSILGAIDNAPHVVVADESTTFRKRREPITLADIQVGDTVRIEGAVKDGTFLATSVSTMGAQGPPPTVPRDAAPSP